MSITRTPSATSSAAGSMDSLLGTAMYTTSHFAASAAGLKGSGEMAAYGATKSAVMRLTESLADELRGDRIRVNAVLPSTIDTPQNRAAMPGADTSRWVQPMEVAEAMAFLLSDRASGVSGALLPVG